MARSVFLTIVLVLGAGISAPGGAARAQDTSATRANPDVATMLRAFVSARHHAPQRWPRLGDVASELRTVYDSVAWAPIWSRDGQPTASARAVIEQLATVDARGLDPADYNATRLQQLAGARDMVSLPTAAAQAEFDLMLSSGALRVLRTLRHGRISARAAHAQLRFTQVPYDAVAALRTMTTSTNPSLQFDEAEPPYLHYHLLKGALARYRALVQDTTLLRPGFRRALRPDSSDVGVPRLRRLLVALADIPSTAALPGTADSLRYDSVLVNGVRAFQRRHAIVVDGVVGPATQARLRVPFDARVTQMLVTLERWRWLPHALGQPPIFVNVPSFRLHVFTTDSDREADVMSMDVVVGQAYDHKTPLFSGTLRHLIFSPYWDVPPSIARKELLPKARRDAGYLERNNYEILNRNEQIISTQALDAIAAGLARIRQRPGPDNALGGVKFIFPNSFNVYMHDTPSRNLFELTRRDLSHGCIRLAEPLRLAQYLLRDQPQWDEAAINAATQQSAPQQVDLRTPVPVYVMYGTAVAREDGSVIFYDDIYSLDRTLARLLAAGYPYSH